MKTIESTNATDWLANRYGSVGGSDLEKMKTKPRSGEWTDVQFEFIAQEFFEPFESNAQRGTSLEIEALEELAKQYDLLEDVEALNNVIWQKDGSALHCSPDATASCAGAKIGIETKCLSAGKHLSAFLAGDDVAGVYALQCANYLYHNPELNAVWLVYYCPEAKAPVEKVVVKNLNKEILAGELEFLAVLDERIKSGREELAERIRDNA